MDDMGFAPDMSLVSTALLIRKKGNFVKLKFANRQQACAIAGLTASLWLITPASMAQLNSDNSPARKVAADPDGNVFTLGTVSVYGIRKTEAEKTESIVDREEIKLLEKKDIGTALSLVP